MSKPTAPRPIPASAPDAEPAADLLGLVEAETRAGGSSRARVPLPAVVVGVLHGLGPEGEALVEYAANPGIGPVAAQAAVALTASDAGREVVLAFAGGDARLPIVLGVLQTPHVVESPGASSPTAEVRVDGERLTIEGQREVVLKCGEASITLTRAGKVLIRGTYVLSRSSGANRIKGASVDVN
jgi:hypothetical protein